MPSVPDFRLETHFSKWELKARYHLTASDAESMSIHELLALASPSQQADFDNLRLGYTETFGAPALREAIAATYQRQSAADVLCFAGTSLPLDRYMALIELCRKHGIYILHDEIFNGLGRTGTEHLPFVADVHERGLSLNVMSKGLWFARTAHRLDCVSGHGRAQADGADEAFPFDLQFSAK